MIRVPTKLFNELVLALRARQTGMELTYRFAIGARGAIKTFLPKLDDFVEYANRMRQDDERMVRELEQLRNEDVGATPLPVRGEPPVPPNARVFPSYTPPPKRTP